MNTEQTQAARAQQAYQAAVEAWIVTIRTEEHLASVTDSVTQVDQWENAHDEEEAARDRALKAKKELEAALRQKFFQFK